VLARAFRGSGQLIFFGADIRRVEQYGQLVGLVEPFVLGWTI
jgi:hypothetical protein